MNLAEKYSKAQPPSLGEAMGRKCSVSGCEAKNVMPAKDNCGNELCATHSLGFQAWILETNPERLKRWIATQSAPVKAVAP